MIAAVKKTGKQLAINWPLRWYPPHVTSKRLIDEGVIGDVIEVHYYDGNRGPLRHGADKIDVSEEDIMQAQAASWFYKKAEGGGSLLDYLGYGVTLGTWYHERPRADRGHVHRSISPRARSRRALRDRLPLRTGLSKFETRWGTFTDPWHFSRSPSAASSSSARRGRSRATTTRKPFACRPRGAAGFEVPADTLVAPFNGPIHYFIHCLEQNKPVEGPLSPSMCRIGQQIVDSAMLSAKEKRTVLLVK